MPVTETGVVPSVYVRFHGAVPVSATDTVADAPLQIVVLPLTAAVGSGFTVSAAEPVMFPAGTVQPLPSPRAVTV